MSSITCTKCGAEIVAGRFCRRCGQPAPVAARENSNTVLEAETRTFAKPSDYAMPTEQINSPLTGPAYIAPGPPPAPPAAATQPLKPASSTIKPVLIGLLFLLLMVPVAFAFFKILKRRNSPPPPVITAPEIPPPPPPPAPGRGALTPVDDALVYPQSETVMNMTHGTEGRVLQLRTRDPIDKVVDWYVEKIKPSSTMKVPGEYVTVLRGEGINVVITSKDDQTEILIEQGH